MWEIDIAATQDRKAKLNELYNKEGLNAERFDCKFYSECLSSQKGKCVGKQYAGGTAAISPFYDVSYNGIPMRTLIDYLREEGVLPQIDRATSTKEYEMLVKDKVNEMLSSMQSNDRLRG